MGRASRRGLAGSMSPSLVLSLPVCALLVQPTANRCRTSSPGQAGFAAAAAAAAPAATTGEMYVGQRGIRFGHD